MSRGYDGAYRVLVVVDGGPGEVYGFTDPAAYEDCERACVMFGMLGMPFEGQRVKRALIVPVAGTHAPEPGTDFTIERR